MVSGFFTTNNRDKVVGKNFEKLHKGMSKIEVRKIFNRMKPAKDPFTNLLGSTDQRCRTEYHQNKQMEIISSGARDTHLVFENVTIPKVGCNSSRDHGNGIFHSAHNSLSAAQAIISKNKSKVKNTNTIEFNIAKKKEQCEAIGFTPKTEKFADCVLRLVELDVKNQQQKQITQAQNSGNDALVKQLQKQNYDRGTDVLLNLGQQLLKPKQYNSNIYLPKTQRCTIQGFGSFAKMVCR